MNKLARMKELVTLLDKANFAYEQEDTEIMSNLEYDKLVVELEELEKELGIIYGNSVTQKIGHTVSNELVTKSHDTSILSLDKTKKIDILQNFLGNEEGLLSYKLDGLTVVIKYDNGNLIEAVTRGDGQVGEDVTANAKTFRNLPLKIKYKDKLTIRGEAIITNSNFARINMVEDNKYKNPRNLCSGSVRQLDSSVTAKRNIDFICFAVMKCDKNFVTKKEMLKFLKQQGFAVVEAEVVTDKTLKTVVEKFTANITNKDFQADGLVLSFNDIAYSKSLGVTSKFPKDSMAYKWKDIQKETILEAIEWNTSRTGKINPVAVFAAVDLEGTTVTHASIHNISMVEELKLGLGDRIIVYKANMIIPQILENLSQTGPVAIPNVCSKCGGNTIIKQEKETKTLYCGNPNCLEKQLKQLVHFVSRNAMDIKGLSEAILEKLPINDVSEIYSIEKYKDEIISMRGFGEKSYTKLVKSIDKSRKVALHRFVTALGIPQVGVENAKLICKYFVDNLDAIRAASEEELHDIEGIGSLIAKEIYRYFNNEENKQLIDKLLMEIKFEQKETNSSSSLDGKVFAITGKLNYFENRQALQKKIEQCGGKVSESISSKTSYLINNEINSTSKKNSKAHELSIPIISEEDFVKML
ncbi:NAD-dependent DNA ligase LigA [Candidatus Epulonipiscium viviparus]|uniref:NAD-dependent DNA ligase LigA n=1 Tax=Candidatus Epulonipiscium viviparus TaxID=420336 RepID=UPI0027380C2C|nr:NAD-dependent DNA ligase LigA [Candidatus Epulopiscium viviparus]